MPSCANTAMCLASRAKGTPRARPDKVPSASTVMRSFGPAGATVISPSGRGDFGLRQQPARQHGFRERHAESQNGLPRSTRQNPRPRLAPEPPYSSATHDKGRPASLSARHSGAFQPPFLSWLTVCASARSANIRSAVCATIFSASATAFPVATGAKSARNTRGLQLSRSLFLQSMMGKRGMLTSAEWACKRGMKRWWRARLFRAMEFLEVPARCGRSPRLFENAQMTRGNAMSKDGLCAIITGSASGLGAATAAILAKGGARIVINYSSSQKEAEADGRSLPQRRRRGGRGSGRCFPR